MKFSLKGIKIPLKIGKPSLKRLPLDKLRGLKIPGLYKLKISNLALWWGAFATLFMLIAVCSFSIWSAGQHEAEDAMASGRRVMIALNDGTVQGKLVTTKIVPDEPVEKPDETPATSESAVSSEKAPEAPPERESEEPQKPDEKPTETPAVAPIEKPGEELPQAAAEPEMLEEEQTPTITPSSNPLADTNPKLVEKSDFGLLPVIGADGTKPWRYYSKNVDRKGNEPVIAIVITGIGQKKFTTEKALSMSSNFTLSFSPYAKNVAEWAKTARLTTHEKLIDIPMEPSNYPASDPGPYGLILAKGLQENEQRLRWLMARFTGHVGFLTPQNEVFTSDNEAFRVILQSLANRGLLLVIGRELAKTEVKDMVESSNTAHVIADMLVDEELTAAAIQARLVTLEQLAKQRGYAVGIAQATPLTLEQLHEWQLSLASKGIQLVPISAIAKLRFS